MDVLSVIIGIIIGIISVGLAIELGMKKTNASQPASRPTHKWSVSEILNPRIVAEHMGSMELPKNAKVVVNQYDNKDLFKGMEVKKHSGIRGNFILGDDRALILSGPIEENGLGIWTVEKAMLDKLNRYFEDSWSNATNMKHEEQ
ncbi:hypothetical protein MBGDF03_00691 [Thermoplasmatales archaeon SCGC AB-540-F20]|nr:hypothetical protein MBGDF03_00691 [Thermoplasmatales archaeon SCGC AB-540-F20]